jgi:hypothetical protein
VKMKTEQVAKIAGGTRRMAVHWSQRFLGKMPVGGGGQPREWSALQVAAYRAWRFFATADGSSEAHWVGDQVSQIILSRSKVEPTDVVVVIPKARVLMMSLDSLALRRLVKDEPVFAAVPVGRFYQEAV